MENAFKKIAKNSIFFSLGIVASKAIHVLLLPLYTKYLSETEYGLATTAISFITTFSVVGSLSIGAAILRFLNEITDTRTKKRFIGSVFSFSFLGGMIVVFIFFLPLRFFLNSILFPSVSFYPTIFCTLLVIPFEACFLMYQCVIRTLQQGKKYSLITFIYLLLQVVLNILLIVILKLKSVGMIISLLAANVIFVVYGIIDLYTKNLFSFSFDYHLLKKALSYSIPQVPHDLSNTISVYIPKVFLNNIVSYATTGLYTVASQISSATGLVQSSVNLALRPWFNDQMKIGQEGQNNIKNFSELIFSVFALFATTISLCSPEIITIFTSANYYEAWKLIPILILSNVVSFIYYIYILVLMYDLRASRYISLLTIGSCLMNLFFSYIFIQRAGGLGAAFASLCTQIVLSTTTVIVSKRKFKVDYGVKKMVFQSFLVLFLSYFGLALNYWKGYKSFSIETILFRGFIFIVSAVVFIIKDWKKYKSMFN